MARCPCPGPKPHERAEAGGRGGVPAGAQVEEGEGEHGEGGGQSEAAFQGVGAGGLGALPADLLVAGDGGEHREGCLEVAGPVVLSGGVRLAQGVEGGGLGGLGAPGPELGVGPELHGLRHGHRLTPGPCGGGGAGGGGDSAGVVAEEQGGDPGVDQLGGVATGTAAPGGGFEDIPGVVVPSLERRGEGAEGAGRQDAESVGDGGGLPAAAQVTGVDGGLGGSCQQMGSPVRGVVADVPDAGGEQGVEGLGRVSGA